MSVDIGQVIRYLRKKKNLTQQELSEGICSREHLIRIEHGKNEPTILMINLFSEKLGTEIYDFYSEVLYHKSLETHLLIEKLNDFYPKKNIHKLPTYVQKLITNTDFADGEPYQHLCYAQALISANVDKNFSSAINHCLNGLGLSYDLVGYQLNSQETYRNIKLVLLHTLAVNFCRENQFESGLNLLYSLNTYTKQFFSVPRYLIHKKYHFHINMYCLSLYNIFVFDKNANINELYIQIQQTISSLLNLNYSYSLEWLLEAECTLAEKLNKKNVFSKKEILNNYKKMVQEHTMFN